MTSVAYDHRIFTAQRYGGISRYFCELSSRIANQPGWKARVIAPLHFNEYLRHGNGPQWAMHLPERWGKRGRLHRAVNDMIVPAVLGLSNPHIVHPTYYGADYRRFRGRKVLTVFDMIHELYPHHFPAGDKTSANKKSAVGAADHLLCISHCTARDLIRILDVPPGKITVTHLGFSDPFTGVAPEPRNPGACGRPYFLYVGERRGYKNFERLLKAYGSAPSLNREFDLVSFGGAPFVESELECMRALGLRPDAVRRETGPDDALARAYSGAQAFVYPSEYEGFGIPPLEAMSRGCPVACSNASSIPEVVGDAAEYFDPCSVDSIRAALERLAGDAERRNEIIRAGYERRNAFSWDQCAADTLLAYERALGT